MYLPDVGVATGAAAVIAPGGALRVLGFDNEGVKLARWLNERGIAGFVLKYRTLQVDPAAPRGPLPGMPGPGARQELVIVNANANPAPDDAALGEVLELAVADAQAALALVRSRAREWRIDPNRVVWGVSALQGKLGASGPWRGILDEYRLGGPPATPLGEAEAAWRAAATNPHN